MAVSGGGSSNVPSLPPPSPKSPPEYPDLYGKRREMARVLMLEREIGFLEEELKSVEGLQPASRCCKEVAEFVVTNPDPLIHTNPKNRKSCRFWKWLCKISCFSCSWICCSGCSWICCNGCSWICCNGCPLQLELPNCCDCNPCNCFRSCACCSLPKCRCCCWPLSCCFKKKSCCRSCSFQCPSCPDSCCCCCCFSWKCSRPKCPKVRNCCNCRKSCCNCNPGFLCC